MYIRIYTPTHALVVASLAQGILAALLSTFVGNRDPDQVNMMAKQAGEVSENPANVQHLVPYLTDRRKY